MGKLIQQKQEAGELASHNNFRGNQYEDSTPKELSTLPEIGVTRKESSTSKNLASIPDDKFEQIITEHIAKMRGE